MWRQNLNVGNGFLDGLEDVFVEDAAAADAEKKKKKDKNGLSSNEIRTHLLKNTTKFWLMIPAFYHFTFLSLQPKKQSPPKSSILCFYSKFCQIEKYSWSCNIGHRKLFSYRNKKTDY